MGKDLYEIETDGTLLVNDDQPQKLSSVAHTTTATSILKELKHQKLRTPSIKFIGKRSSVTHKVSTPFVMVLPVDSKYSSQNQKSLQTGVQFTDLKEGAWYGRPKYNLIEIDAILSGGASSTF